MKRGIPIRAKRNVGIRAPQKNLVLCFLVGIGFLFSLWLPLASASSPAGKIGYMENTTADTVLVLSDNLNQSSKGKVTGGKFLPAGGWQVNSQNSMIFYDLKTYIKEGIFEIDVKNFEPRSENTSVRHHVLSMYTYHWGEHHQVELLDTDWNLHTGFNYSNGIKLQSATFAEDRDSILTEKKLSWDRNRLYHLKFIWKGDSVQFFRDDSLLITNRHHKGFLLRYIFLGRDNTICGDYVAPYLHQQYPAMVGPIFSNLRVKKIVVDSLNEVPQTEYLQITALYANAATVKWGLSARGITRLLFKMVGTSNWKSTEYLGPPAKQFEFTIDSLLSGKQYEIKIITKGDKENSRLSSSFFFTTRKTGYFLVKPLKDTFVEKAGVFGTERNLANMGWLYLMVGKGRQTFLQFPMPYINSLAQRFILRLHVRNKTNNDQALKIYPILSSWNENETTWDTKPAVEDSMISVATVGDSLSQNWVTFRIQPFTQMANGLNIAIFSPDTGWVSFDSRESYFRQPELIIDYRKGCSFTGIVSTIKNRPIPHVKVIVQAISKKGEVSLCDTVFSDFNGYWQAVLPYDVPYHFAFSRETFPQDRKAISIFDAFLTVRLALGLDNITPDLFQAADANNDKKINFYDALLIAKASVGLDPPSDLGLWRFQSDTLFSDIRHDTLKIEKKGILVGDVDFNWPGTYKITTSVFQRRWPQEVDLRTVHGRFSIGFPSLRTQKIGAFSIDIRFDPDSLDFSSVSLPEPMESWQKISHISAGRVQIGLFNSERQWVDFKKLLFNFSEKEKGKYGFVRVNKMQLDDAEFGNFLLTGIHEKEKPKSAFVRVYPNPFNSDLFITWHLPNNNLRRLLIYNPLGECVLSKGGETLKEEFFHWNGKSTLGFPLPSGLYFIILETKTRKFIKRVTLLK